MFALCIKFCINYPKSVISFCVIIGPSKRACLLSLFKYTVSKVGKVVRSVMIYRLPINGWLFRGHYSLLCTQTKPGEAVKCLLIWLYICDKCWITWRLSCGVCVWYLNSSFTKCSKIQAERKKEALGTLKYGHHRCCFVTCIDSVDSCIYKKMSMNPVKIIKPDL